MKQLHLTHHALSIGLAAALLAGCGGSQPPNDSVSIAPPSMKNAAQLPKHHPPELYVSNWANNTITVYRVLGETPIRTISRDLDIAVFSDLAFDKSGNLYSANYEANTVTVYASGSARLIRTISTGLDGPRALAFDESGNLYVVNESGNTVTVYAGGSSPVSTISDGVSTPTCLAFDSSGNLYVGNASYPYSTVTVYAPGSGSVLRTLSSGLDGPNTLAFNYKDDLFVLNWRGQDVRVFAAGTSHLKRVISHGIDD